MDQNVLFKHIKCNDAFLNEDHAEQDSAPCLFSLFYKSTKFCCYYVCIQITDSIDVLLLSVRLNLTE